MKIAVVDGYSTGRVLSRRLKERGARSFHVQSRPDIHPYYLKGFQPSDFEADLGHDPDIESLVTRLGELGVERVVPGTESGVLLADRLSDRLGLPGNRADLADASCDKTRMAEVAASGGVVVPRGRSFRDAEEAVGWYRSAGLAGVVAKPVASAGSDHVYFCDDAESLLRACRWVLETANVYGDANDSVLVQERVFGTEYFVDTVSCEGHHKIAEVWRYTKTVNADGIPLYDYQEPVTPGSPEWLRLRDFTRTVLDVLGIRNSPAHTEVMLTDSGPVLIETGARLGGGTLPDVVDKQCGLSQTTMYVDSLFDPGWLIGYDDAAAELDRAVRFVDLNNRFPGVVASLEWRRAIEALPTFAGMATGAVPGHELGPTTCLLDSPGFVYLAADDPDQVVADYDALRTFESQPFYTA
ncbi:ATP-grasp domain-containing protein [Actinomadura sp. KC216]|nr:ATP-grasp domain-containing protein [Actinomadura sp. KC216]